MKRYLIELWRFLAQRDLDEKIVKVTGGQYKPPVERDTHAALLLIKEVEKNKNR